MLGKNCRLLKPSVSQQYDLSNRPQSQRSCFSFLRCVGVASRRESRVRVGLISYPSNSSHLMNSIYRLIVMIGWFGVWLRKIQMVLLTANRSMKGKDSLEQVMREKNVAESLPVVTIGNADRLLNDPEYRGRCVESLVEIALSLDSYRGARRVFIPS